MGILDEVIEAVEERLAYEDFIEAVLEHGAPTEPEFEIYQRAIATLAQERQISEYEAFRTVDDWEIVDLLCNDNIDEERAEDIINACAIRWKPTDLKTHITRISAY